MGIYIELFSNLIQTFTLTWFISSFFGYKYFGIIKYLGVFIIWFAEFIAISYMNLIIVYEGLLSIIFASLYIIYAMGDVQPLGDVHFSAQLKVNEAKRLYKKY